MLLHFLCFLPFFPPFFSSCTPELIPYISKNDSLIGLFLQSSSYLFEAKFKNFKVISLIYSWECSKLASSI